MLLLNLEKDFSHERAFDKLKIDQYELEVQKIVKQMRESFENRMADQKDKVKAYFCLSGISRALSDMLSACENLVILFKQDEHKGRQLELQPLISKLLMCRQVQEIINSSHNSRIKDVSFNGDLLSKV